MVPLVLMVPVVVATGATSADGAGRGSRQQVVHSEQWWVVAGKAEGGRGARSRAAHDGEMHSCRMVDSVGIGGYRGVRWPDGRMATWDRAKV